MTLRCHVPPSHIDCVRSLTLVPVEERVPLIRVFGEVRTIPAWCIISKHGRYKGDLGYIISFNAQSGVFDVLAASRELEPLPRYDDDEMIGQDIRARRLFSPESYGGVQHTSVQGLPTYKFKQHRYVVGLLLLQLPEKQVRPCPTPSPHQISLHLESKIAPSFMNDTLRRYNQKFWKPLDRVVVNDAAYFGLRARLVSIDHENDSAIVETQEINQYFAPLSTLERLYQAGDLVRIVVDPCSDRDSVHHQNIGKSGIVTEVDILTQEVTFLDDDSAPVSRFVK